MVHVVVGIQRVNFQLIKVNVGIHHSKFFWSVVKEGLVPLPTNTLKPLEDPFLGFIHIHTPSVWLTVFDHHSWLTFAFTLLFPDLWISLVLDLLWYLYSLPQQLKCSCIWALGWDIYYNCNYKPTIMRMYVLTCVSIYVCICTFPVNIPHVYI